MSKRSTDKFVTESDALAHKRHILDGAFDDRPWGDGTAAVRRSAAVTVADKLPREDVRDVLEALGLAASNPVKRFSLRECFGALTMLGDKS